jgi:hypothetical protein
MTTQVKPMQSVLVCVNNKKGEEMNATFIRAATKKNISW